MAISDMKGTVTTTGMMNQKPVSKAPDMSAMKTPKGPVLPPDPTTPVNPFQPKPTGPVLPEKAEQNLEQELLSKFPGLKNLTAEDNAALDAILSPTVKQALGKVVPELEPIFSQFGTNEPNVVMPISIVSNYAMRKYGGNQNEALAAFVDDVSGQMEQQTNVPPSQGLMTSPQNMETV